MKSFQEKIDWKYLFTDNRARVYLLWTVLVTTGFVLTHFAMRERFVNGMWLLLSVAGFIYMARVMPLKDKRMQSIYLAWFVPILIGMIVSVSAFKLDALTNAIPFLGSYWLLVMAVGYMLNGISDEPSFWYWVAVGLHVLAAAACYLYEPFQKQQYLIAAIVSAWSLLNLWVMRSSDP